MTLQIVHVGQADPIDHPHTALVFAQCRRCFGGAVVRLTGSTGRNTIMAENADPLAQGWVRKKMWPEPPAPDIPDHLPTAVERVLLQAEQCRTGRQIDAAGLCYGKALDIAFRGLAEGRGLHDRIKALGDSGKITADLAEWAMGLKAVRNDATHEPEELTPEDLDDFADAIGLILRYLFTMPGRLADIKHRRDNPHA